METDKVKQTEADQKNDKEKSTDQPKPSNGSTVITEPATEETANVGQGPAVEDL